MTARGSRPTRAAKGWLSDRLVPSLTAVVAVLQLAALVLLARTLRSPRI
jgi:hypothetical protein